MVIQMIEIDLRKLERGTGTAPVKVTRGGKTFYQQRRVGRKETTTDKPGAMEDISINDMSDDDIDAAFKKGKPLPLTVDKITKDGHTTNISFSEPGWHATLTTRSITKEKKVPGRTIVEWRKKFQETEMELWNGTTKKSNYATAATRVDVDDVATAKAKVTKGAELVRKRLKGSVGLDIEYDSNYHSFDTKEEIQRKEKASSEVKAKKERIEREEEERKSGASSGIKDISKELAEIIESGQLSDIFANKPEILYSLTERIVANKDEAMGHIKDTNSITGEPSDKAVALGKANKLLAMSADAAHEYIKDPGNRAEIGKLLNVFMGAVK